MVWIAILPGHVEDPFLDGAVEQGARKPGVDRLRQTEPDVQPAGRPYPLDPVDLREELVGRGQDGVDLAAVAFANTFQVGVEKPHLHHGGHQMLVEVRRAEIEVSFLGQDRLDQPRRQDPPADADPR